ncbi:MAG: phosphatidylglycerophosphatase A [Gammaproteobacteria bacterium]|nr:phosphatidylglycerophosphatase A [Gammaproteobacteria bacterium]
MNWFWYWLNPFCARDFWKWLRVVFIYLFCSFLIPQCKRIFCFFVVDRSLKEIGNGDHNEIVIDEMLAMMLVAHFIPADPKWAITAFLIFRFFDIAKPFPIKLIERSYNNALGIMIDDVIAAIYSIILILILKYLLL